VSVDLSGQRLGHYLVQEVIGRGGLSVVYRALDQRLERLVALKVMSENLSADPEFRSRFLEEARAASAIDHVNVVPLYDFGEAGSLLFIAMRLVDGTDLARELGRGPMPIRRVMSLLGQVGAALDMLHERGLVHLDVKPANVLITRNESVGNEHVYLADFGLTRRGPTGHRTASGDFLGSPTYASPEHLRGQEIVPRSDEYSLTCMLFTALAGRPPFIGDIRTVITGHLSGVVPSLSALTGLPPAIDRVIARGMATDPAARYATSSDLLSATRRTVADLGDEDPRLVAARETTPRTHPGRFGSDAGQEQVRPLLQPPGQTPTWTQISNAVQVPVRRREDQDPQSWQPSSPTAQVLPSQFGPEIAGRRPASHRVEPAKPKWPWIVAGVALVVVVLSLLVVVVLSVNRKQFAPVPGPRGSPAASEQPFTSSASASPSQAPSRSAALSPTVLLTRLSQLRGGPTTASGAGG